MRASVALLHREGGTSVQFNLTNGVIPLKNWNDVIYGEGSKNNFIEKLQIAIAVILEKNKTSAKYGMYIWYICKGEITMWIIVVKKYLNYTDINH